MSFNKTEAVRNAEKFLSAGKIKQAVNEYQQIVKRDPEDITNVNILGDLLVKCGETKDALQNFCKVAEHYAQKGFPQKAVAVYNKILRLKPDCVDTLAKLAEMNRQKGATAEARVQYTKLAEVYEKNEETKKLLWALRALAAIDKQGSKHLMKIGEICRKGGMGRDAAEAFAEAGERYLAQEKIDQALDAFSKSLEQDSENVRAFQGYVRISLIRGTAGNAIEKLEDILNEQPENTELRELLSECYMEIGEELKAEEILMTLVAQNPERYKLLLGLLEKHLANEDTKAVMRIMAITSDRLLTDEKPEDVLRWTNAVLELDPNNIEAMRMQARLHTSKGDVLSATTILERIAVLASRSVESSAPQFNGFSPMGNGVNSVEPYGLSDESDGFAESGPETAIARFETEEDVEPAPEFIPSQSFSDDAEASNAQAVSGISFDDSHETAREYTIDDAAKGYADEKIDDPVSEEVTGDPDAGKDMGLAVSADEAEESIEEPRSEQTEEFSTLSDEGPEMTEQSDASPDYGFEILAITETKLTESRRHAALVEEPTEEASAPELEEQPADDGSDAQFDAAEEAEESLDLEDAFVEGYSYPTLEELAASGFGDDEATDQELTSEEAEEAEEVAEMSSDDSDVSIEEQSDDSPDFGMESPDLDGVVEFNAVAGDVKPSDISTELEASDDVVYDDVFSSAATEIVFDTNQSDSSTADEELSRVDVFLSAADELADLGSARVEVSVDEDGDTATIDSENVADEFEHGFVEASTFDSQESADALPMENAEDHAEEVVAAAAAHDSFTEEAIVENEVDETAGSVEYTLSEDEDIEGDDAESVEGPAGEYAFETESDIESIALSSPEENVNDEEIVEFGEEEIAGGSESPDAFISTHHAVELVADEYAEVEDAETAQDLYSLQSEDESIETIDVDADPGVGLDASEWEDVGPSQPSPQDNGHAFDVNTETVHYVAFEYSDKYSNGNGNGNGNGSHALADESETEVIEDAVGASASEEFEGEESTFSQSLDARIEELVAQMNFELASDAQEAVSEDMPEEDAPSVIEPVAAEMAVEVSESPVAQGPAVFIPAEDYDAKDLQGFILRTDFRGRLFLTEFNFDAYLIPDFVFELPDEAAAWADLSDIEIDEAVYPQLAPVVAETVADFVIVPADDVVAPAPVEAAPEAAVVPTPLAKVLDDREKKLMHLLEGVDFFLSEGFFEVAEQSMQSIIDEYGDRPEFAPYHERIELFISHSEPEKPIAPANGFNNASLLSTTPKPYDPEFPELDALGKSTPEEIRKRDEVVEIDEDLVFDYETCYDTATAYREMGLLDYAVREFENALKLVKADDGTRRFFQCCTMLGHCFMDYGKPDLAVTWFRRAQETPGLSEEEDLAVLYEIANALESHGKTVEAAKLFGHINASSMEYRDASQRFYRLRNGH